MFDEEILKALRLFSLKLSKSRRAIKELAIDAKVIYVPELTINSLNIECRTIVHLDEYQEFNLSLKNQKLEFVVETLKNVYYNESIESVNEELDTLFRRCTAEPPRNLTAEELLKESIHAFSKSFDQEQLFYNEYTRSHPNFYNGTSITKTDFVIACRKAGLFDSGVLHDEILKHYREDMVKLVEVIENLR